MGALEEALASAGALAPGQKAEDELVVTGGTCVGAKGTWAVRKHSARPLRTVLREARSPARQVSLHVRLHLGATWAAPLGLPHAHVRGYQPLSFSEGTDGGGGMLGVLVADF